jgi:hypothetical protein
MPEVDTSRYFTASAPADATKTKETIDYAIRLRSNQLAAERDRYARRILEDKLPRSLHWLIDRPRLLQRVLRIVPLWRPTMTMVDLRGRSPVQHAARMMSFGPDGQVPREMPYSPMTDDAARVVANVWVAEMRAAGRSVPDSGLIFTYTDASGLPAQVCGVE